MEALNVGRSSVPLFSTGTRDLRSLSRQPTTDRPCKHAALRHQGFPVQAQTASGCGSGLCSFPQPQLLEGPGLGLSQRQSPAERCTHAADGHHLLSSVPCESGDILPFTAEKTLGHLDAGPGRQEAQGRARSAQTPRPPSPLFPAPGPGWAQGAWTQRSPSRGLSGRGAQGPDEHGQAGFPVRPSQP